MSADRRRWDRLWVVEMLNTDQARCRAGTSRWEPTVGVGLTREAGRIELERWREENPDELFRLRAYERAEGGPR